MSEKHEGAVKTILGLGEEKMGAAVNQLLSNEAFVRAVQRTVSSSLEAKRGVDKGVAALLGLVNVPTLADVDKVKERMDEVESTLAEIAARLEKMRAKLNENRKQRS